MSVYVNKTVFHMTIWLAAARSSDILGLYTSKKKKIMEELSQFDTRMFGQFLPPMITTETASSIWLQAFFRKEVIPE